MPTIKANLGVSPQDVNSSSATAGTDLGAYATTGDGRGFRYCLVGATALVPGKAYQAAAEDTTNQQALTVANLAVGATSVVTSTTVTLAKDLLAGGFLTINSATTGAGYTYKIKGNTAASAAVTTFTLEEPIQVATTGTTVVDVKVNPYASIVVAPTTQTSCVVGVASYPVTALYYGWVQTHGPAALLAQGTITVGTYIAPAASSVTGTGVSSAAGTLPAIGFALTGIASTDYGLVFLTID